MTQKKIEKVYLLRLWQEKGGHGWRCTLTSPITNERYGFGHLGDLFEELEAFDQRPCGIHFPLPDQEDSPNSLKGEGGVHK